MIPTREQIEGGEEYLGWARQKLSALEGARRESGSPALARYYYPSDGVEVFIWASENGHLIRITEVAGGFICHPRDDAAPGGRKPDGTPLQAILRYPIRDDDHGSRTLAYSNGGWDVSSDVENYGNLDWIGQYGEVVSWRGPAGRHISLDPAVNYPGYTIFDYETIAGVFFTPYRNIVYRSGNVDAIFIEGSKVLGAGEIGETIVAVVSVDYDGRENPDGGSGGFYDEVYLGVARIGFRRGSRPSLPWFFSGSGLSAVNGNSRLDISESLDSVEFSTLEQGEGTVTETGRPYSVSKSGSWPLFREYSAGGDTLITGMLSLTSTDTTDADGDSQEISDPIDIYRIRDDGTPLSMSGAGIATVGTTYTASGGNQPYKWSISAGSIDEDTGEITAVTCGSAEITVTDTCGDSATKDVRFPDGAWISVSWLAEFGSGPNGNAKTFAVTPYPGTSCGTFNCVCTEYSGKYRFVYYTTCCDSRSTGEYPINSLPSGDCGPSSDCYSMQNCLNNNAAVFVTTIYLWKWVCA